MVEFIQPGNVIKVNYKLSRQDYNLGDKNNLAHVLLGGHIPSWHFRHQPYAAGVLITGKLRHVGTGARPSSPLRDQI